MDAFLEVEVCYATPDQQSVVSVRLPAGATLRDALDASGVLARHPEIDLATQRVGIYGKIRTLDTQLMDRDRVEIYRALIVDPKLARQRRVEKARRAGSVEGRKWMSKDAR
jgi:uncharacterized protein